MQIFTPAVAIAYSQWCRHRKSLMLGIGIFALLAAAYPVVGALVDSQYRAYLAVATVIPLLVVYSVVMNALLLVDEAGNFSSGYVKSMLTLPASSVTLAFWPMVYGSIVMVVLWLATALVVYRPLGLRLPLALPALMCAAGMAWLQAVSWLPWAKGSVRELVTVAILTPLVALPVSGLIAFEGSRVLVGFLMVGYLAAAFVLGYAAVVSSRRGTLWPLWPSLGWVTHGRSRAKSLRAVRPFESARRAQFWYEWTCHGWVFPVYIGLIYSLITGVLFWRGTLGGTFLFGWILVLLFCLPLVMAGSIGPNLGLSKPFWIKGNSARTFLAARPVSSGELVIPKYQMAFLSGVLTWLIVVGWAAVWIVVSSNLANARALAQAYMIALPGWRSVAVAVAALVLLPGVAWRLLTDFFPFALTGRRVIADGCAIGVVMILMAVGCAAAWLYQHPWTMVRFLALTPVLVSVFALLKGAIAFAAYRAALRWRLLSWRQAASMLAIWLILSASAMLVTGLTMPESALPVSTPVLLASVGLLMPLARLPLAVLAMEWNRHR